MKKTIFINNNLILEDATEDASNQIDFGRGVEFISNTIKGLGNITTDVLNTLGGGISLLTNLLNREKFDKNLKEYKENRQRINNDWKDIRRNLGIEESINEFLSVVNPGISLANKYTESIMFSNNFKEENILTGLVGLGKPITSLSKSVFDLFVQEENVDNESASSLRRGVRDSSSSEAVGKLIQWAYSLSDESSQKFEQWKTNYPEKFKNLVLLAQKSGSDQAIKVIKSEIPGLRSESFRRSSLFINSKKLILEEKDLKSGKEIELAYAKYLYTALKIEHLVNLQKKENENIKKLDSLLTEFQKFVSGESKEIKGFAQFNQETLEISGNEDEKESSKADEKETFVAKILSIIKFLNQLELEEYFIDEELELKQKAERKIEDIKKQIKDLNLPSNLLKLTK